jgi:hypothetical protein
LLGHMSAGEIIRPGLRKARVFLWIPDAVQRETVHRRSGIVPH